MNLGSLHKIYFLGIGGIGMSALARYFHQKGIQVSGYDKTPTDLTLQLEKEGISITYDDSLETLMPDPDLVVLTPAIPKDHKQWAHYRENQFPIKKRAEVLGLIANSLYNISISGSHGKTSTSSITAHLLNQAQKDVAAFLGGICINFNSNYLVGNTYAVVEADEFDRSFLQLHPDVLLITAIDTDHLDIYGSFEKIVESFTDFTSQLRPSGTLVINSRVPKEVVHKGQKVIAYSVEDDNADYFAYNIKVKDAAFYFDVKSPCGVMKDMISHYGGRHNVENALGAMVIGTLVGLTEDELRSGIASFKGVKRRFETHIKTPGFVYIDDYAHHPREIEVTLDAVRELYPGKHLTVVFQPHLFSRTRDLADGFVEILSKADRVILLDIYPARELPIPGVTSELVFDKMCVKEKILCEKRALMDVLKRSPMEVLVTIGAGDIDTFVQPIIQTFSNN